MALAVLDLVALLQAADAPSPLTVAVEGVRDAVGEVRVESCSRSKFGRDTCEFRESAPAERGRTVVSFPAVPAGEWAVQAYHDRNANHEVDRGPLGLPIEEVGFSRQPPVGLHGPVFGRSAFVHQGAESITVRLKRYLAPGG